MSGLRPFIFLMLSACVASAAPTGSGLQFGEDGNYCDISTPELGMRGSDGWNPAKP